MKRGWMRQQSKGYTRERRNPLERIKAAVLRKSKFYVDRLVANVRLLLILLNAPVALGRETPHNLATRQPVEEERRIPPSLSFQRPFGMQSCEKNMNSISRDCVPSIARWALKRRKMKIVRNSIVSFDVDGECPAGISLPFIRDCIYIYNIVDWQGIPIPSPLSRQQFLGQ